MVRRDRIVLFMSGAEAMTFLPRRAAAALIITDTIKTKLHAITCLHKTR